MNFSRIAGISLRQFYLIRDTPTRFISIFTWIILDLIIWGFISKYLTTIVEPTLNVTSVFIGAIVLWGFLVRSMLGVLMAFLEDSWSRNFLNVFASPIRISEYLAGLVLTSTVTTLLGLGGMLVVARLFFGASVLSLGLVIVPYLFILFLFGVALGIFGIAIVLRFGPASEWFVWPIPAILNPFVGVFYPIAVLPQWMQYISSILPPSYVFDGMRMIISQGSAPPQLFIYGLLLVILHVLLASAFFAWVYNGAIRSGLLARYSAENVI